MNLIRKGHRPAHRGVIGIESAIVLIAFVIVAAALAFVVLNMGFATTQKAKTAVTSAIGEAGSSLTISGKVIGHSQAAGDPLNAIMVPLKLTSGGNSVDLNTTRATISYLSNTVEYDNMYRNGCTLANGIHTVYSSPTLAWAAAPASCIDASPITGAPAVTSAIIYWAVSNQVGAPNSILEPGEHAILSVGWGATEEPTSLDKIKIELAVTGGATLTTERTIPNISTTIIDLG